MQEIIHDRGLKVNQIIAKFQRAHTDAQGSETAHQIAIAEYNTDLLGINLFTFNLVSVTLLREIYISSLEKHKIGIL